MIQKFKRPISILLALLMVAGIFTALPFTVSAAEDKMVVLGSEAEIFGGYWDTASEDYMTRDENGVFTKTYTVNQKYDWIYLKCYNAGNWYGDSTNANIGFRLKRAGSFTVTATPQNGGYIVSVSGDIVAFNTPLEYNSVYAVGDGDGGWLNGASWDPAYVENEMAQVSEDVWEISFENVPEGFDRRLKFAIDGAWTHNFGGSFEGNGVESEAVYNGDNIRFDTPANSTVTARLDLSEYDANSKTGAKFTITITEPVAEVGDSYFVTLKDAIDAVQDGQTITILKDCSIDAQVTIPADKAVTIDFRGKTVDVNVHKGIVNNGTLTLCDTSTGAAGGMDGYGKGGLVDSTGTLTINSGVYTSENVNSDNSTCAFYIHGEGSSVEVNGGTIDTVGYGIYVYTKGTVTVNAGTITSTNQAAISGNGNSGNGQYVINVNGGNLISQNDVAIYHPNNGTLAITGGTITGKTAIYIKSGATNVATSTTSINGATITGNGAKADYAYNGNGCNPTGDAIVIDNCGYPGAAPSIAITGGTITSVNNKAVASYASGTDPATGNAYTPITGFVSGGTFNTAVPEEYCATGYIPENNGDGTYGVKTGAYVAQVGDTGYETLAAAIDAAQDDDIVKLIANVTETVTVSGKTLTLDLNGFNITSASSSKMAVNANNGAKLTINNSNTAKSENTPTQNAILGGTGTNNRGSLSASGADTTVDICAGYYYGYNGNKTAIHAINGATITFYDCVVNGAQGIDDSTTGKEGKVFYSGVNNPTKPNDETPGYIVVHGGVFNGRMSDSNWGNYLIDGGTFDRNSVVLNENPVNENGDRVATSSGSMTQLAISPGTLYESGWLAPGYAPVANANSTFTVDGPYAAMIGNTGYETLAAAITAAQNGDTVKLVANVTEAVSITGKTLTLDLNGFNITSPSSTQPIKAYGGTKLTITNSNRAKAENTPTQNAVLGSTGGTNNYGSLFASGEGTEVIINAGYYYGYNGDKTAIHAVNKATVTFNDCVVNGARGFDGTGTSGKEGKIFYSGVGNPTQPYAMDPGYIVVHGGTFSGRMSDSNWGNYLIDGGTFDRNAVVINENPVDADGNRQATASGNMTKIKDGTFYDSNWLAPGFAPVANGDGTFTVEGPYAARIGDTTYATVGAAFAAAVDGDTITLLADSTGGGIKVMPERFKTTGLTVDFDGYTYTIDSALVGSPGYETQAFHLEKNNKITMKDGTITSANAKMLVQNYSDLTLKNMTLDGSDLVGSGRYTLSNNNGNIVIDGSTIIAKEGNNYAFDVCRYSSYPSVNVTVTGNSVINGDIQIDARNGDPKDGFSLTLVSGTMTGNILLTNGAKTALDNAPDKADVTKKETFDQAAPAGYMWVDTATEGEQTLAKAVAKIGNTNYASLAAAFAAAVDGDTITLLADSTGNGIQVPQGKFQTTGLTVDFGGFTYTVVAPTVGSTGTETQGFQLLKNNKITFKNGKIAGSSRVTPSLVFLIQNYSDLTLDGMTLELIGRYYSQYTLSNNNGEILIEDSIINAPDYSWANLDASDVGSFAFDVCRYASYPKVSVTVVNSVIHGDVQVDAGNGDPKNGVSLTLVSGTMSGDILLTEGAETALAKAETTAAVTKKNTFDQDPPEGYAWIAKDAETDTLGKVVTGHTISLDGNIALNFYLNANIANIKDAVVNFTVDNDHYKGSATIEANAQPAGDRGYKVSFKVPAAYMAHQITATITLGGDVIATDTYSIEDYAFEILADQNQPDLVKTLVKEMLNYGAKAYDLFKSQAKTPVTYQTVTGYTMTDVTADQIKAKVTGNTSNMKTVGEAFGAKCYTTSLIYLSESTLRVYFVKADDSKFNAADYDGCKSNYYYYVDVADIAAAQLDDVQTFHVGNATFQYSALDYAALVVGSNMDDASKDLAKSMFLYNQAAQAYFNYVNENG